MNHFILRPVNHMNITSLFIIFRAPGYTKAVCASPTRKVRMKMKIIFINVNHFWMISYDRNVIVLHTVNKLIFPLFPNVGFFSSVLSQTSITLTKFSEKYINTHNIR